MTTWIALLRGINVGGRTLRMADLRTWLDDAGYEDVVTYIQSGNVVFRHAGKEGDLVADLEARIADASGMRVPVVVRSAAQWQKVVAANPYPGAEGPQLHVVFLAEPPARSAVTAFDAEPFAPEEFTVVGREVYMSLPNGMGLAKLPSALPLIRGTGTARNWRTVLKLAELAGVAD